MYCENALGAGLAGAIVRVWAASAGGTHVRCYCFACDLIYVK